MASRRDAGLHLPITSMASLHLSGSTTSASKLLSNNADNGSLSSSNSKTKAAVTTASISSSFPENNNSSSKPKRAGFSLPLAISNNLPSVLPKKAAAVSEQDHHEWLSEAPPSASVVQAVAPVAAATQAASAQSKRCRFALKDATGTASANNQPSFHTSTSSNASTVIEQPNPNRRSRSPSKKLNNVNVNFRIAESKITGNNDCNDVRSGT